MNNGNLTNAADSDQQFAVYIMVASIELVYLSGFKKEVINSSDK